MMTRRAASRDLEDKLRATLKELEASKNLCSQLLQERDDSEVEVKRIVDKNTELKNQLAELHIEHMDMLDQHQHLRQTVTAFEECQDTHDTALRRISQLEDELREAQNTIAHTNSVLVRQQAANTNTLFDKLVGSGPNVKCVKPTITIDLTGDDTLTSRPFFNSRSKVKKYIKINKLIKKYNSMLKQQNTHKFINKLRKDKFKLINELSNCNNKLELSSNKYNDEIYSLQEELMCKETLLNEIFSKYESSQQLLSKRMQEASELVDLVKYNAERYESLTNNLICDCAHSPPVQLAECGQPSATPTEPQLLSSSNTFDSKTLVFSDGLGSGFGHLLNNFSKHNVINCCYPNIHFNDLIHKITHSHMEKSTTLVLLMGNSLKIKKSDLVNGVNALLNLNMSKVIICALPYSNSASEQVNNYIYSLNNLIHMLTCRHSDRLVYFDTNNFVRDFIFTREGFFLSKKSRHLLANLLAYNINAPFIYSSCKIRLSEDLPVSTLSNSTAIEDLNF